ncbi:hypothetical protein [Nonomuraea africana]|uniref:Uncharacterized protein n=1 Tax=Nonomuraea africana TaxID=46171 RepID=A0ABR9KNL8_9ACTN|nr:hypothetical protein [Nonomuraea africana]MBE1563627.1 hypothetical protein [Nonomuraea africana]
MITLSHSADAVFDAMLEGWARQQRGTGRFQPSTIDFREQVVRRFARFTGAYPLGVGHPSTSIGGSPI